MLEAANAENDEPIGRDTPTKEIEFVEQGSAVGIDADIGDNELTGDDQEDEDHAQQPTFRVRFNESKNENEKLVSVAPSADTLPRSTTTERMGTFAHALSTQLSQSEADDVPQTCFSVCVMFALFPVAMAYAATVGWLVMEYDEALGPETSIFSYEVIVLSGSPIFVGVGILYGLEPRPNEFFKLLFIRCAAFVLPFIMIVMLIISAVFDVLVDQQLAFALVLLGCVFAILVWVPLNLFMVQAARGEITSNLASGLALTMCFFVAVPLTFLPIFITLHDSVGWKGFVGETIMVLTVSLYILWTAWAFFHKKYFVPTLDYHRNPYPYYVSSISIVIILSVTVILFVSISFTSLLEENSGFGISRNEMLRLLAFLAVSFILVCLPFGQSNYFPTEKWVVAGVLSIGSMIYFFYMYTEVIQDPDIDSAYPKMFLLLVFVVPACLLIWTGMSVTVDRMKPTADADVRAAHKKNDDDIVEADDDAKGASDDDDGTTDLAEALFCGLHTTYPIAAGLVCTFVLFPMGILAPSLMLFDGKLDPTLEVVCFVLIALPVVVALAAVLHFAYKQFSLIYRELLELYRQDEDHDEKSYRDWVYFVIRRAPVTKVGMWFTVIADVVGVLSLAAILLLFKLRYPAHVTVASATVGSAFVTWYSAGMLREDVSHYKYVITVVLYVILIPAVCGALWGTDQLSNDVQVENLVKALAVASPLAGIIIMLMWKISDFFADMRVLALLSALCCCCLLVPVGMIAPAVSVSSIGESYTVGRFFGVFVTFCMITTCTGSMALNERLQRIKAARKTKTAVMQLRRSLIRHRLFLDNETAISIYHFFVNHDVNFPNEEWKDWLLSENEFSVLDAPEKNGMRILRSQEKRIILRMIQHEDEKERLKKEALKEQEDQLRLKLQLEDEKEAAHHAEHKKQYEAKKAKLKADREAKERARLELAEARAKIENEVSPGRQVFEQVKESVQSHLDDIFNVSDSDMLAFAETIYTEMYTLDCSHEVAKRRTLTGSLWSALTFLCKESGADVKSFSEISEMTDEKLAALASVLDNFDLNYEASINAHVHEGNALRSTNLKVNQALTEKEERVVDGGLSTRESSIQNVAGYDGDSVNDELDDKTNAFTQSRSRLDKEPLAPPPSPPNLQVFQLSPRHESIVEMWTFDNQLLQDNATPELSIEEPDYGSDDYANAPTPDMTSWHEPGDEDPPELSVDEEDSEHDEETEIVPLEAFSAQQFTTEFHEILKSTTANIAAQLKTLSPPPPIVESDDSPGVPTEVTDVEAQVAGPPTPSKSSASAEELVEPLDNATSDIADEPLDKARDDIDVIDHQRVQNNEVSEVTRRTKRHQLFRETLEDHFKNWCAKHEQALKEEEDEEKRMESEQASRWNSCLDCFPQPNIDDSIDDVVDYDDEEFVPALSPSPAAKRRLLIERKLGALEEKTKLNQSDEGAKHSSKYKVLTWAECGDLIDKYLHEGKQADVDLGKGEDFVLEASASNGLAVLDIMTEFYALNAVPFGVSSVWELTDNEEAAAGAPLFDFPESWDLWAITFWICIAVALIYPLAALFGLQAAKSGKLGRDSNGNKAATCSFAFFETKILSILGSTMYFTVMVNLVDAFVCAYDDSEGVPGFETRGFMLNRPSVECWTEGHALYAVSALIAGLLYYPMASFMYPNMQFVDDTLDIKFSPTFLIFVAQGKLFLAGLTAFFGEQGSIILSCSLGIYVAFAVANYTSQPCLINRINMWKTASYVMSAWTCVCAFVATSSNDVSSRQVAFGMLYIGWFIVLAITIVRYIKLWGVNFGGVGVVPTEDDNSNTSISKKSFEQNSDTVIDITAPSHEETIPVNESSHSNKHASFLESSELSVSKKRD